MRLLAAIWIFQGLLQWSNVLLPSKPVFDTLSANSAAAIVFFAIFDLVAAVGLWLATPWGGVLWLFAAFSQVFVALVMVRNLFSFGWVALDLVLIVVYFVLTWQAGQSSGQFGKATRSR
jgi:uncharacterized membrane protein (DUF2068 family)